MSGAIKYDACILSTMFWKEISVLSVITLTLLCGSTKVNAAMLAGNKMAKRDVSFSFNITEFASCVGANTTNITLYSDDSSELVVAPVDGDMDLDYDLWLDCIGEQELDGLVSVTDGTYDYEYDNINNRITDGCLDWEGSLYFVSGNSTDCEPRQWMKRNCCDCIAYGVT